MISTFFQQFISIFMESAPWLLLGFFIAGLIKAFISTEFLHKHLGGNNTKSVVKGAVLGAPLPLCSCGVIPAALGLRRAGASKASTTSFLIATPETGVDSVTVSYALLGPLIAVVRPIAAVVTAISVGLAVLWFDSSSDETPLAQQAEKAATCCAAKVLTAPQVAEKSACCSSQSAPKKMTFGDKVVSGLQFTFIDLIKDTVVWLLIGLLMAAVIMTILPPEFLAKWGASPYAYIIMALIGVPMYICATASTPIAAGLLFAGVSPGAILVFLLVGPATNVATLAIVKKELGARVLTLYLSCIVSMAFLFGLATDALAKTMPVGMVGQPEHVHESSMVAVISAIGLAVMLVYGLWNKYIGTSAKRTIRVKSKE